MRGYGCSFGWAPLPWRYWRPHCQAAPNPGTSSKRPQASPHKRLGASLSSAATAWALSANDLQQLIDATRRRPPAEYGRTPIKVEPPAGQKRKRANWTYEPVTPANIDDCEKAARVRLEDKPELVAQLEALGRKRALIYKTLAPTGLRFNELRSLTMGAADLEGTEPYAVLAAADEKARRGADIPLRAELAADLRQHLRERQTEAQRNALREGRPVSARLPVESPLLIVSGESLRVLDLDLVAAGLADRACSSASCATCSLSNHGIPHVSNNSVQVSNGSDQDKPAAAALSSTSVNSRPPVENRVYR